MIKRLKKRLSLLLAMALTAVYIPAAVVYADLPSGWSFGSNNGAVGSAVIDTEICGEKNPVVKLEKTSERASNQYLTLSTRVPVEKGKTYYYGADIKAQKAKDVTFNIDWSQRLSLTLIGSTYDWTPYKSIYKHTSDAATVELNILIDGVTEGLWVDNVFFYEVGKNKTTGNLITNPGFDGDESIKDTSDYNLTENEKNLEKMQSGNEFTEKDLKSVRGGFAYMPAYPKGSEEYISFPVTYDQYKKYTDVVPDLTGAYALSYDEDNLYVSAKASDKDFVTGDELDYYNYDSIQFCIAALKQSDYLASDESTKIVDQWGNEAFVGAGEDTYGYEIGVMSDGNGGAKVYCEKFDEETLAKVSATAVYENAELVYNVTIPWNTIFKEKPDSFLFDGLINDNDGDGRKSCIFLTDGIESTKSNGDFAYVSLLNDNDIQTWISGGNSVIQGNTLSYGLYLYNPTNEEKNVEVKSDKLKLSQTIKLSPNAGNRIPFSYTFDERGNESFTIDVKDGDKTVRANYRVDVGADISKYNDEYFENLSKRAEGIKKLLDECEAKGIATDYETVNYTTIERFIPTLQYDVSTNAYPTLSMIYNFDVIERLCTEAEENLKAYLDGTKTSDPVPRYVTSDKIIEGETVYATAQIDDKIEEKRPTFFNGHGHFDQAKKDIPNFQNFGNNIIQCEVGPTYFISAPGGVLGWGGWNNGFSASLLLDSEEKQNGNYSMKLECHDEQQANKFFTITQYYTVKPNTTYYYGLSAKGTNVGKVWFSVQEWNDQKYIDTGTYDWKNYDYSYTTGDEQTSLTFRILVDSGSDSLNIDDVYLRKGKYGDNMIYNGDFEDVGEIVEGMCISRGYEDTIAGVLEDAEKNNVAVSLLISPHYFPSGFDKEDPGIYTSGGYWSYDTTSEVTKKIFKMYLSILLNRIKDYKSLNDICLSNEPTFHSTNNPKLLPRWYEYLRELYNNDIAKLNLVYGTSYTAFEEVDMPRSESDSRYAGDYRNAICFDWQNFNNMVFTEFHQFLADTVHEIIPNVPVHSKIMSKTYFSEKDNADFRRHMFSGSDVESFTTFSQINGNDTWEFYNNGNFGYRYLESEMLYDLQRSINKAPVFNSEMHPLPLYNNTFEEGYSRYAYADYWNSAIHGRVYGTTWVWQPTYDKNSEYYGLALSRPDMVEKIGKVNLDLNRLAYEVTALQTKKSDVAILYSNAARNYSEDNISNEYSAYASAVCSGQKVEFVTEKTIEKIHDYKLLILPKITNLYAKSLDEIVKFIENGGKVAVIDGNTLQRDEHNLPHDAEKVKYVLDNAKIINPGKDDIRIGDVYDEIKNAVDDAGLLKVRVVNADTGKDVTEVEWQSVEYNGKTIINICNYNWGKDMNVKIFIDGKECGKYTDLLNKQSIDSTIKLNYFEPRLLQVEG